MKVSLVVNFSFILRLFLLERRKLPLCELQLILRLEKTWQHVITMKEFTLKKICRRTWVWKVWDINEVLLCNWNVQHFKFEIPSKNVNKKRDIVLTLIEPKFLTEVPMITRSQNFFWKTDWMEKRLSHFSL